MPRPRKSAESTWYDLYCGWPVEERAIALRILSELHRQKIREHGTQPRRFNGKTEKIDFGPEAVEGDA